MPRTDITKRNRTTLTSTESTEDKIFRCMRVHRSNTPVTCKEIANEIGVSISTVYRSITKLLGKPYTWGDKYYRFEKTDNGYLLKKEKGVESISRAGRITWVTQTEIATNALERSEQIRDEKEIRIYNLAQKRVCTADRAKLLTSTVVAYEIKVNQRAFVRDVLKSIIPYEMYLDIVPYSDGLYIILNEPAMKMDLKLYQQEVLRLYEQLVKHNRDAEV